MRMKEFLCNLKMVNDLAQQCIRDIQENSNLAMEPQYQEDILIVGMDHREVFKNLRKRALAV